MVRQLDPVVIKSNPFKIQISLYKLFGLWQFDDEPFYGSPYYKAYGIVLHTCFTFLYIFLMGLQGMFITGLDELTKYLYIILTEIAFLSKMINFVRKRYAIRQLIFNQLHDDIYEVLRTDRQYITQELKSNWYINVGYLGVSLAAAACGYCTPILEKGRSVPFATYYYLPFVSYPLDWEHNLTGYILLYAYQSAMTIHCCLNVTCDLVMSSSMNCVAMLHHTLGDSIEQLGSENSLETKRKFRGYIIRHEELLGYTKSIENVFSVVIFTQFCMSVFVLCVSAFQISIMSPSQNPTNFILYIFYILAMVAQFYLPCFFGNEIISKSSELTNKIYFSNWIKHLHDKCYRRMIIIFMERLKRPSKMTAGRLFSLSLQTFTSIINSAYSFYALLQNMQKG